MLEGNVVHLMATRVIDRTDLLDHLSDLNKAQIRLLRSDAFKHPRDDPPRTSFCKCRVARHMGAIRPGMAIRVLYGSSRNRPTSTKA